MNEKQIINILNALGINYNMEELKQALSKEPLSGNGKACLFSRVSTLGQDLTQQNDELYAEAKRNGYEDIVLIEQKESGVKLDEQKQRIIRECIKSVYVDIDGVTNHGKIIEIHMIDGIKHTIHMTKKGNDFITNIVLKDKEMPLNDLQITARFIRKKK